MGDLSIKNVPAEQIERLKLRAKRNHRSLQGELMAIIEAATADALRPKLSPKEVLERVRALGVTTADEATAWIRHDRDTR